MHVDALKRENFAETVLFHRAVPASRQTVHLQHNQNADVLCKMHKLETKTADNSRLNV